MSKKVQNQIIYTIGHSTHPIDEFVAMLNAFHIQRLIDVRTIPKSRFNPPYNLGTLNTTLHRKNITYQHMPGLGGLRHPLKDSINNGWRNASFRGYADYMQTDEFINNLQSLIRLANEKVTAMMCAEAVPWRCHRSLISDALVIQGIDVLNIMNPHLATPHKLNPMACLSNHKLIYPTPVAK